MPSDDLSKAERLNAIAERIGFALWQLQNLETAAATYYVLIAKATPGMGFEAGQELVDGALSKTFGTTVRGLEKSEKVPIALMGRFQRLLAERNWLVHSSRSTSSSAVHDDAVCAQLIRRVSAIEEEALALTKEAAKQAELFLLNHGFSRQHIDSAAQRARNKLRS